MSTATGANQGPKLPKPLPDSILIVGAGVFGLSTALALSARHSGKIRIIESSPTIPNPHGSSVDSSRIVRADYANAPYSALAESALKEWRNTDWGRDGRYTQNGLVLVSNSKDTYYVRQSYENVRAIDSSAVEELVTKRDVERVVPGYGSDKDLAGGYVNWGSGWADAEASVRFAKEKVEKTGRVEFLHGDVARIISELEEDKKRKVTGVELSDGSTITADLVILATGAWTGRLVDMRGKAEATGQVLSYIHVSDSEQASLSSMPTILNLSTGIFIIPPRNNVLKIARHAYGYRNPRLVPAPADSITRGSQMGTGSGTIEVSLPENGVPVPWEGERACRAALKEMLPAFADRPFIQTRVCWYTDTPKGDFIISHHPSYTNLFLATGGSGHGFKFLPVLGDKIVDAIQGTLDPELSKLWSWDEDERASCAVPEVVWTEDGSRSGPKGLILMDELARHERDAGSKL